ncbi:MAG TPA: hypothetical protein VND45_11315 [Thermoanaerobaculia bacterium]|jgi:hypothetical protein|nr:hypothetical protein [Thermoanaerobaculia bacterium]
MRRFVLVFVALGLACSRDETPAPTTTTTADTTATTATTPPPAVTQTTVPELQKGTYDEALLWMRSAKHFRFTLRDGSVHAEGEMSRKTPGAEQVRFTVNDERWEAAAGPQGVAWKRGGKPSDPPPYGSRLYQRVTLPFDPAKKEGVPLLVTSEGDANLYRFTDANSGKVHEVSVRKSDSSIAKIRIGDDVELTFAP